MIFSKKNFEIYGKMVIIRIDKMGMLYRRSERRVIKWLLI